MFALHCTSKQQLTVLKQAKSQQQQLVMYDSKWFGTHGSDGMCGLYGLCA